ncbi:junctional cadherin 5-associated protein [Erythrolamprus reginae]|uniref:junctional cadherin 5-associated protein n=1 Tax=Erythrolamprus reginae TaxID=121349 RepID=UPI00396C6554
MFSKDGLLITSAVPVDRNKNGDIGRRSGQAPLNGLPLHPGAIPKTNTARGHDQSNLVDGGRQWSPSCENFTGPVNVQRGLYDQPLLSRSSHSKKEKNNNFQRQLCQDFGAHDYSARVDSETIGMASASVLLEGKKWLNKEGLEDMRSNKEGTVKPLDDYRRQSSDKYLKQPIAFGQCEPDINNKERPLQDVCSGRQNIVASHVKNKAQTFPRFISSEISNYVEIPAVGSSEQYKGNPELESLKQSDPTARPKSGRPLKPPSYEFHQQSRGIVESNPPQDGQQKPKTIFYVTRVEESSLEPPLYIPPPSYKSPSEQSNNQPAPDSNEQSFEVIQNVEESTCSSSESSIDQLQMEDEEKSLHSNAQVGFLEKHLSSVQYIPFNDPRIRHIKVIHPGDFQVEDQAEGANNTSIVNKNHVDQEFKNSALDQNSCALSTQRGFYDTGNGINFEYPKARQSSQSSGAILISPEICTKVKTFPFQGKNHLNKKTNETMFCLVSVPSQSEPNIPVSGRVQGASGEDKSESNRDLKEQSFLSMSSTDLELQALTGNMINKDVSEKQDFQRAEFKQMHNLSSKKSPKHKELGCFGSWTSNEYKDPETQTSFKEQPKARPFHGSQLPLYGSYLKKTSTLTNGHFLKYGPSTTESAPSSLPADNRNNRPIPPPRKAPLSKPNGHVLLKHGPSTTKSAPSSLPADNRNNRPIPPPRKAPLNKPTKPECPKTLVNPKTGQNEVGTSSTGLPRQKNEPSFAPKEERKSPCSIKEAFGQFLLKPVGRRPWDAISELESFNQEIQKQEDRDDGGKENEGKYEREEEEEKKMKKAEEKASKTDEASQDHRCSIQTKKAKVASPLFKKGTNKSKHESENISKPTVSRAVLSELRNVRSEPRELDKTVKKTKGNINQRHDNTRKIIKLAIRLPPVKPNISGCSDSAKSKLFNTLNTREANAENHNNKDLDKLKMAAGKYIPTLETASVAPLSFKKRNQGHSDPNLRSVDLDGNGGTSISSTKKIPSNESLHTRASRILGIEVAVESLTTDNKTLPPKNSDKMAQSNQLPSKNIPRAEMTTGIASSKGKPKSTFIGESVLGSVKDQHSGGKKLTQCSQQHPDLSKHQAGHAQSLRAAVPPLDERKSLPSNVEKKNRRNSKITVIRQGQVASAANRAALDRMARMKEVHSVSRMRLLSTKNEKSGEDREEEKEPGGKRNDSAVGHTETPRRLSQGSCVSKHVISLNEKEHLGNRTTKKHERDLPSSEVYDPSQVERV